MASASLGGGTGAVAASTHAACARFRGTDPLVVGRPRRRLAQDIGFADESGRIPEARWMRAMTFERLVRDKKFASEVATTVVGKIGLARPTQVVTVNAQGNADRTADLLKQGHDRAITSKEATLVYNLAIPLAGFETADVTPVKPDFAVIGTKERNRGSWLIVGDAKDYERVRSRIDDKRLLKGFLQVAVGAESAAWWSRLPYGMNVHSHGVLAVPRNAFLQPEALVDLLDDHRTEVRMRIEERCREAKESLFDSSMDMAAFVASLQARFDPATCTSCSFYHYCRNEIRTSAEAASLLVELGIPIEMRNHVIGLLDGSEPSERAPASVIANIKATLSGRAESTGQRRLDPVGLVGTINVVIAKSDSAALGIHGIGIQSVGASGPGPWQITVFDEPQSPATRRRVMEVLGHALAEAMAELATTNAAEPTPLHLVVPDQPTADILASMADNLAGIEISRLRWDRDHEMGRLPLTFNGEPAQVPTALSNLERTAVSFLLEEDRARALKLRSPIVDIRAALARHVVAGGPAIASYRLDYLTAWAESISGEPVEPRKLEDEIEALDSTPGARLTNARSDQIHQSLVGTVARPSQRLGEAIDPKRYVALVTEEIEYKCTVMDRAADALAGFEVSNLREVYRAIEGDAQSVWGRRLKFHASDLVRFGRTYRHWRNALVDVIEGDRKCNDQLLALANPQAARDLATDAGVREIASATVVSTDPLVLEIDSRRIGHESRIILLHIDGEPSVELAGVEVKSQKGSFRFSGMAIGPLEAARTAAEPKRYIWSPQNSPVFSTGDKLVVAELTWFSKNKGNRFLNVARPKPDDISAPKPGCELNSHTDSPQLHRYCCRSHEVSEAEFSDQIAARRARGELNPQIWPPVVDGDAFEVSPTDSPRGDIMRPLEGVPEELTIDDLE